MARDPYGVSLQSVDPDLTDNQSDNGATDWMDYALAAQQEGPDVVDYLMNDDSPAPAAIVSRKRPANNCAPAQTSVFHPATISNGKPFTIAACAIVVILIIAFFPAKTLGGA